MILSLEKGAVIPCCGYRVFADVGKTWLSEMKEGVFCCLVAYEPETPRQEGAESLVMEMYSKSRKDCVHSDPEWWRTTFMQFICVDSGEKPPVHWYSQTAAVIGEISTPSSAAGQTPSLPANPSPSQQA